MISEGSHSAKIIILGEAPGPDELRNRRPFSGSSGFELDKMLNEAKISRSSCFLFNVTDWRPADGKFFLKKMEARRAGVSYYRNRLPADPSIEQGVINCTNIISSICPNVIIALGDMALWAITGEESITKWRGSILETDFEIEGRTFKVIPTYNPAFVQRNWPVRWVVVQDLRRAARESLFPEIRYPDREYTLRPTFDQAMEALERTRGATTVNDLEVIGKQISCVGIGFNRKEAISIPFISTDENKGRSYWLEHEELEITKALRAALTDKRSRVIFQNGHFDLQVYAKQWGYLPNITDDTMIAMHVVYPEMRKALDFMASLFCIYYRFWKDDGKYWNPETHTEEQHWAYNCDDCVYTYEVMEMLWKIIEKKNLQNPYRIQMDIAVPTIKMMLRGVGIDQKFKNQMFTDLTNMMKDRSEWFEKVLGHPLNPLNNAPTGQMRKLFYGDFQLPPVLDRKKRTPSLNDEALDVLKKRKPVLTPLINAIQEYRSLHTFKANFADAKLSDDGRMRCSINISKVKTFRFSTEKNIWGEGSNLQNISKGTEKD